MDNYWETCIVRERGNRWPCGLPSAFRSWQLSKCCGARVCTAVKYQLLRHNNYIYICLNYLQSLLVAASSHNHGQAEQAGGETSFIQSLADHLFVCVDISKIICGFYIFKCFRNESCFVCNFLIVIMLETIPCKKT